MQETPTVLSSLIGSKHLIPKAGLKEAGGRGLEREEDAVIFPELFLQWRIYYGKFCLTIYCNLMTVSCISIHKLQDTLKVIIITKSGTRVLME